MYLVDTIDEKIATEAIPFMNVTFSDFHCNIHLFEDPWTTTYNAVIRVVQNSKEPVELIEAVKQACDRSDRAELYIGHVFEQKNNSKLRSICIAVKETSDIERVGEHPTIVRWIKKTVGDAGESQKDITQLQTKKNNDESNVEKKSVNGTEMSKETSLTSPISPVTLTLYCHIIKSQLYWKN